MGDSVTSIYLDEEQDDVAWEDDDSESDDANEIVFPNGACTLGEPTDDTRADQIGKDLQQSDTALTSLHLNYTGWTRWGAHEICNYIEASSTLEEVTLQFDKTQAASITNTRTLAALGEALALNTTAKIRQLRLFWVQLQAKSVAPLCQFLARESFQKLVLVEVALQGTTSGAQFAAALRASPSLQTLSFLNVSNTAIQTILQEMSLGCPSTFRSLEIERSSHNNTQELETTGLEALLKAESCLLKQIKFNTVQFGQESVEGLHRGLENNSSVQDLTFRDCPIQSEPLFLREMPSVQHLQLDCFPIQHGRDAIHLALYDNTSITHCELFNLPLGCGRALRDILSHNRTLQSLKLNNSDRVLANPDVDVIEVEAMEAMAEGLRVNTTLQSLTLKALGLNEEGIGHLAQAVSHGGGHPLDLTLDWDSISIESLDHFSKALRSPTCRLRHLQLELEDSTNISLNAGMIRFLEGLERAPHLESVHLEPSTEDEGLAPPVFGRMAHALLAARKLTKWVVLFGMANERVWREMDPQIITQVQTDLFIGLAKNYSLEHLQFANTMYRSQTAADKEFWKDVSFFGMRNRLLKGLDRTPGGGRRIADEINSVVAAQSLAKQMVLEELASRKPWTLRRWKRETVLERHELNELSLLFLCLQHLPHLLVAAVGTTTATTTVEAPAATQPFIPLMELD